MKNEGKLTRIIAKLLIYSKIHNWILMTLIRIVQIVYLDGYHNSKIHESWPTFWTANKDREPSEEMIAGIVSLTRWNIISIIRLKIGIP